MKRFILIFAFLLLFFFILSPARQEYDASPDGDLSVAPHRLWVYNTDGTLRRTVEYIYDHLGQLFSVHIFDVV